VPRVPGAPNPEAAVMNSLYGEHAADLRPHAMQWSADASAAEDVFQETLLRAWQHPEVVADPGRRRSSPRHAA
jgi:RNA polymerase sigma-70 factor, ECF subfamily